MKDLQKSMSSVLLDVVGGGKGRTLPRAELLKQELVESIYHLTPPCSLLPPATLLPSNLNVGRQWVFAALSRARFVSMCLSWVPTLTLGDGGWAGADAEITVFQWVGDGWVLKMEETIRTSLSQRGAKVFSVLIKCFGLFLVCSWCGFVGLLLACSRFVLGFFLIWSWPVLGFFFASY